MMVEKKLITTGKKEKLSISKGSEIEVAKEYSTRNVWYRAILEENLSKSVHSKKNLYNSEKKITVRYLDPFLKQDSSPPSTKTISLEYIRPVPPPDLFPDVGFEEGDMIDAVHNDGWCAGWVVKVLGNRRYSVYLMFEFIVIEIERKNMRPHMVWRNDEWFRCGKQLIEADFSGGDCIEVRAEVDGLGEVWSHGIAIKDNEDGTFLVWSSLCNKEHKCIRTSLPYSKIRPPQPPLGYRPHKLMDKVDVYLEYGWCPGVVSEIVSWNQYVVVLGPNKESQMFDPLKLRPSLEWKNGLWLRDEKVSDSEHEGIITPVRATLPTVLGDQKIALATHSSGRGGGAMENPPPISSNGVDVAVTGNVSVTVSENPVPDSAINTNVVIKENTPVTRQLVLGTAATTLTKPVVKTSPGKKLQGMKNQKGSKNDSDGEKAPEETTIREVANKRKRGRPCKDISTEPKQKTRQSVARSPDPVLNSVVEKHVDVVETPPAKETTMALPFAKKSPLWKVLESMEVFKAMPQHPHFSPLLESEEESREGDAIGKMMMYADLIEKITNLQADHPISSIKRIDECLLKLEKHGFNVKEPRSRIAKLLSIKERRKKYEEDTVELHRVKAILDTEIAQLQSTPWVIIKFS